MQLINIPSSWYGHQYRCVVDGANSSSYVVIFTDTWKGTIDNLWEKPGNWSCGSLPDANTDVIINTGDPLVSSNVACRSVALSQGANLTVSPGYTITVTH